MGDHRSSWGARARRLPVAAALFGTLLPSRAAAAHDAIAMLAQGDTASAIAALEARVRAEPTDTESHYQLGRLLALRASHRATEFEGRQAAERHLEDGQNLVHVPPLPVSPPDCGGVLFCENFSRPERFNALLYEAKDLSHLVDKVRDQVLESYRTALAYDPAYLPAARGMLALFHDEGRWEEYQRVARGAVAAALDSAWAHLLPSPPGCGAPAPSKPPTAPSPTGSHGSPRTSAVPSRTRLACCDPATRNGCKDSPRSRGGRSARSTGARRIPCI